MSGDPGTTSLPACPGCDYCLGGHDIDESVTCPECGASWCGAQIAEPPARRFRTWMIPAFLLPAAALTLLENFAHIGWRDEPLIAPIVFVVLLAMAYFAARDEGGRLQRLGAAVVLAEFLWLISALLVRFPPLLTA